MSSGLGKEGEFYYRMYPIDLMNSPYLVKSNSIYGITGYFPSKGRASNCSEYTPGSSCDIAISGDYSFFADEYADLQIIYLWSLKRELLLQLLRCFDPLCLLITSTISFVENVKSRLSDLFANKLKFLFNFEIVSLGSCSSDK